LLAGDEQVRSAEEYLGGQVTAQLPAEGALDRDRLNGKHIQARGHIAAAPLALHDELLSA
jgi:hypothetical protein